MYAKCGVLAKARQLLEELPTRNVVTWNALIAGYVQQGQGEDALKCLDSMQFDCCSPDAVTFICALKACGAIKALAKGEQIHEKIMNLGMLEKSIVLGTTLVDMYARCGALAKAQQVLSQLPARNMFTWTALIEGYVQHGQGEKALECFDNMQFDGHSPDEVTLTCALKACGTVGATAKGEQIHEKIVKLGMLEKNVVLGNALVDMYARCDTHGKAREVLMQLPIRDVITWTTLIAGYAQHGQGEEALKCFDAMQCDDQIPNAVTFTCALQACGSIGAAPKGKEIHQMIVSLGMLEKNVVLGNALVDMYARCGTLAETQCVFAQLPFRDVVTWTALLQGYAQQGQGEAALKCFDSMQHYGLAPNVVTFTFALQACGSIGASTRAERIHQKILSLGMLEKSIVLGTTVVDLYAKYGAFAQAEQMFAQMLVQDVVSWTSLIAGYALHGLNEEAVNCFERMQSKGVKPDSTALIWVLNACCYSGLSDKAQMYFSAMSTKYGVMRAPEHCCCMINLFGRVGKFNKALDVIQGFPVAKDLPVWTTLLGFCDKWGEVEIGRFAFERALDMDKNNAAIYVSLSHIYPAASMQRDADKIEVRRLTSKAWRIPAGELLSLERACIWGLYLNPL